MKTHELLKLFREEVFDLESPPMWSNTLVYAYMDEAQKQLCRLTDGIPDSTSDAAILELESGEAWATLSPAVLQVRSARDGRGRPLALVPVERIDQEDIRLDDSRGTPRVLVTGMEEHRVRVVPIPDAAAQVQLNVFRLPLRDIVGPDQDFEVRAEHVQPLLDWMMHRAYGRQDAETYDKGRARDFEEKFRRYCDGVKREQARLRRTPHPIAYGGY